MSDNKVKFGLKNVHYAPLTIGSGGTYTFATPIAIPGAVNLSLDPNGEPEIFYADCVAYYTINNNLGYTGDLEIALIPESFRTGPLGETADTKDVIFENANNELQPFALLFEFEGDQKEVRHVIYNCIATRPAVSGQTNEESKSVQTETLNLKATPLPDGLVKGKTTDDTDSTVFNGWYSAVYTPTVSNG